MNRSLLLLCMGLLAADLSSAQDPRISSWHTEPSGQYARIYPTLADQAVGAAVTTWNHPTGADQLTPTYAGIHEVSSTPNWVYIRTTNLASYVMGPWYLNAAKTNLFPNYPSNQAVLYRLPRNPVGATNSLYVAGYSLTGGGPIGYFVDGVAMFDSRDAFSYSTATMTDVNGAGAWNRDAYVNEGVTFDAGNAHQAGGRYHYHANPPGLRHLLGDSIAYAAVTNTYTESFNGKHSPIIAWCRDGLPIYGPYGYSAPLNANSPVTRLRSGYQIRAGLTTRNAWPAWATRVYGATGQAFSAGPNVSAGFPLGRYMEDNDYKGDLGMTLGVDFDLNEYNVRYCVTPEFPGGTWAYFTCINASGVPVFPYNIGRSYFLNPVGNNSATLPGNGDAGTVTTHFQGGPEKSDQAGSVAVHAGTGDVTVSWNGVQGAEYEVDYSTNLSVWKPMVGSMTAETDQPTAIDAGIANSTTKQFYRTRRVGMAPFDATGFDYTPQTFPTYSTLTVTLSGIVAAPTDLNTDPAGISFNGQPVLLVGRPAQNQVQIRVDISSLPAGNYPVSVTFAGASGTHTGTVVLGGGGPITTGDNVLLLIVDDWGVDWSPVDSTSSGVTLPKMPTLQSLAAAGLRFTNAYAEPICSPTRAAMMTGRHPFRNSVGNPQANNTLPASELALPEVFTAQASPYALGSFGKWHLGSGQTGASTTGGWNYFKGILQGAVPDYFNWNKVDVINGVGTATNGVTTYATTDQVNDAVNWIGAQGTNPWFCWMAFTAPHDPFHEPPAGLAPPGGYTAGNGNAGMYRRMLEALDTEIGRLLAAVDLNKTNVIIIGDNGSPGQVVQAPFGAGHAKGDLYQGGVRVPLVVRGPAVNLPGGSTSPKLVHCVDLFSTILQLGGIDPAAATAAVDVIDSNSIVPILQGVTDTADRCVVVEKFGIDSFDGRAILSDDFPDFKLIIFGDRLSTSDTPTYQFFNIATDVNEQSPLNIASLTEPQQAAYDHLIAKDAALGGGYSDPPVPVSNTLYLQLPTTPTGAAGVPANMTVLPTSITVNGLTANFVGRLNQSDVASQYWIKCTVSFSGPYSTATVAFPNNPNTGDPRVFTTTLINPAP